MDGALPPHDHAEPDDAMRGAPYGLRGDTPRLCERAKRVRDEARGLIENGGDDAVVHRERDREPAFSGEELCGRVQSGRRDNGLQMRMGMEVRRDGE